MAVRCGSIGLAGLGAHDHYDQLSIELYIKNQRILYDPGTFIYTPLQNKRQLYRSINAHNGPKFIGIDNYCIPNGMFDMRNASPAKCLYVESNFFIGELMIGNFLIYRMIVIKPNKIEIIDFSEQSVQIKNPISHNIPFSQGYGQIITEDGCLH